VFDFKPPRDKSVMYPPPPVRARFLRALLVAIITLLMVALCLGILFLLLPEHPRGEFHTDYPGTPSLAGVSMISADDGWAVGDYNNFVHYADGL
jgi:hypothetical protein